MAPKISSQIYVLKLQNLMIGTPEEGGLKEEICAENNTIVIDSTVRNILPSQLKNMYV